MSKPLHVLIVEDSEDDALLLIEHMRSGGYDPIFERVDTEDSLLAALEKRLWEIVISDYVMPEFRGFYPWKRWIGTGRHERTGRTGRGRT